MYLYETHLHTAPVSACASNTPQEMVRAYQALGYTGFIVTDHFFNGNTGCPPKRAWAEKVDFFLSGYRAAKKEGDALDFDVFLGWEYAIRGSEFLTYGLDEAFLYNHPNLDRLAIEDYSTLIRKNGGYLAQAHPYREAPWVRNPRPVAPHLIDGIEVHNASQSHEPNKKAAQFARLHNLPAQAGTDAHSTYIPHPSGIKLSARAPSIQHLIAAIKNHETILQKR
ncbi:MAG: PHP domain-containing protein [Defluviitaleaceae bacterium]|nr:PHP domain-containing protein [Defluviitaleaceae bacterium]MCL2239559.1 PHP domain-containing protein [Defluviitaleaceae bacterium]